MRIKLCYNTSTEEFEILEETLGEAHVKKLTKEGDEIIFFVSTVEEEHGNVYEHPVG